MNLEFLNTSLKNFKYVYVQPSRCLIYNNLDGSFSWYFDICVHLVCIRGNCRYERLWFCQLQGLKRALHLQKVLDTFMERCKILQQNCVACRSKTYISSFMNLLKKKLFKNIYSIFKGFYEIIWSSVVVMPFQLFS